jgi:hypothetical protein
VPFLAETGGELLIEICRFFAALAVHDPRDDRFHIDTVMGPDEFHDGYPCQPGSGVRDNAYTNILTAWLLYRTIDLLQVLDGYDCGQLRDRLHVSADETARWNQISRRLTVPFHADGIISQFDGALKPGTTCCGYTPSCHQSCPEPNSASFTKGSSKGRAQPSASQVAAADVQRGANRRMRRGTTDHNASWRRTRNADPLSQPPTPANSPWLISQPTNKKPTPRPLAVLRMVFAVAR